MFECICLFSHTFLPEKEPAQRNKPTAGGGFNPQNPDFTALGSDTVSLVWGFINAALPLLSGAMGLSLLRGDK